MRRGGIRYVDNGGLQIAYQVVGEGPIDIVFALDWATHLDLIWEDPRTERFLRRFTTYGRLIMFDMRGIGLSDPVDAPPPLETWMDDVSAVMDAVGSERASLVGRGHAGQLSALFAASHPERTSALVMLNSFARLSRAPDYPWGMPEPVRARILESIRTTWGTGVSLLFLNPTLQADEQLREFVARLERAAGGPQPSCAQAGLRPPGRRPRRAPRNHGAHPRDPQRRQSLGPCWARAVPRRAHPGRPLPGGTRRPLAVGHGPS